MHATPAQGKKSTPLRRNLRFGLWDGVMAMPLVTVSQPGNFVLAALMTGTFAFSTRTYGFLTSLPYWFNFLQVLLTPLLAQRLHARSMTILSSWLQAVGWLALLIALPFLPRAEHPATLIVFGVTFSIVALSSAINGVAWNAWMQECIPVRLRGKYFGFRNRLLYLSLVVFMLAVSGLLAWLDSALLAFQLLFGGALAFRVVSVLAQQRMQTSTGGRPSVPEPPWKQQLRLVRDDVMYVRFIGFAAVIGFASTLFGPFYAVFMLEELHLSAARINLLLLLGVLGAAISFPAWGRLLDRFGNVPVMIVSLITWQLFNALYAFVHPGNIWLLYVINAAGGIFSAGYGIGLFGLLLKLSPAGARTMGMALFVSLSSFTAALGPLTGGYLLSAAQARGISPLEAYHAAFLVTPILFFLCCLLLRRVREPNSSPVTAVVDAMRTVRTMASLFGLSFLVNQVFYRPGTRHPPSARPAP
ncbi:MAG: MFS transporter [Opitutaceae bacterium]